MYSEQSIAGNLLNGIDDKAMLACLATDLKPSMFEDELCRAIYAAALDLWQAGEPIDIWTIQRQSGQAMDQECLEQLMDGATLNHRHHAETIRRDHATRQTVTLIKSLERAVSLSDNAEQIEAVTSSTMDKLIELRAGHATDVDLYELGRSALEAAKSPKPDDVGYSWPIRAMSIHWPPLPAGLHYWLSKRSGGKSAIALQCCLANAIRDTRTSYWTGEMSAASTSLRLVSALTTTDSWRLVKSQYAPSEIDAKLDKWDAWQSKLDLIRFDDAPMNIDQFEAWAVGEYARGSRLIFADNLRNIKVQGPNRVEQFEYRCERLEHLKKRIPEAALIVLHHMKADGTAKWSGAVEDGADIVVSLDTCNAEGQPIDRDGSPEIGYRKWYFEKWRDGPAHENDVLRFDKVHQQFQLLADYDEEQITKA